MLRSQRDTSVFRLSYIGSERGGSMDKKSLMNEISKSKVYKIIKKSVEYLEDTCRLEHISEITDNPGLLRESTAVTEHYLWIKSGKMILPIENIGWIYKQDTAHKVYGFTVSHTYSVIIKMIDGAAFTVLAKDEFVKILADAVAKNGYTVFGYTPETELKYKMLVNEYMADPLKFFRTDDVPEKTEETPAV